MWAQLWGTQEQIHSYRSSDNVRSQLPTMTFLKMDLSICPDEVLWSMWLDISTSCCAGVCGATKEHKAFRLWTWCCETHNFKPAPQLALYWQKESQISLCPCKTLRPILSWGSLYMIRDNFFKVILNFTFPRVHEIYIPSWFQAEIS